MEPPPSQRAHRFAITPSLDVDYFIPTKCGHNHEEILQVLAPRLHLFLDSEKSVDIFHFYARASDNAVNCDRKIASVVSSGVYRVLGKDIVADLVFGDQCLLRVGHLAPTRKGKTDSLVTSEHSLYISLVPANCELHEINPSVPNGRHSGVLIGAAVLFPNKSCLLHFTHSTNRGDRAPFAADPAALMEQTSPTRADTNCAQEFREAGFDDVVIEELKVLTTRAPGPHLSPSDRYRIAQHEQQRLVTYAGLFFAARAAVRNEPGVTLFYPAAGLDIISVIAIGVHRAVLLDRQYFQEMSENDIRDLLARCFGEVTWLRVSPDAATALINTNGRAVSITFIGADLEHAESPVVALLKGSRTLYLAKGCEQTSVVFPPAWIAQCHCIGYAVDAPGPALPKALPILYTDIVYQESRVERELILARNYRADGRPDLE